MGSKDDLFPKIPTFEEIEDAHGTHWMREIIGSSSAKATGKHVLVTVVKAPVDLRCRNRKCKMIFSAGDKIHSYKGRAVCPGCGKPLRK